MARELERAVVALARECLGATVQLVLPERMRSVERRTVDAVLHTRDSAPRILEVDEKQHFNVFRAATLKHYIDRIPLAFDGDLWLTRSEAKTKLEGGGFAKPKPPLFPGDGGRHRQRAFRDALSDILPIEHEWSPTLRIADFEVRPLIAAEDAREQMSALLRERLAPS